MTNYINTNGFDFIAKASGTGASSINIDNCFSNRYSQYKIVQDITHSTDSALALRLRSGGSTDSSSIYKYQFLQGVSTSINAGRSATSTNWYAGWSASNQKGCSIIEILNPFQSTYTTSSVMYAENIITGLSITCWAFATGSTTSYDGFSVIPTAGTITGDIYVYGYVES